MGVILVMILWNQVYRESEGVGGTIDLNSTMTMLARNAASVKTTEPRMKSHTAGVALGTRIIIIVVLP